MQRVKATAGPHRIAMFHAYWNLHSNPAYFAQRLANAGYVVDVFAFRCTDPTMARAILEASNNVFVHTFDDAALAKANGSLSSRPVTYAGARLCLKHIYSRLPAKMRRFVRNLYDWSLLASSAEYGLLPPAVLQRSVEIMMRVGPYKTLIGVEKGGLLWAGQIAQLTHSPLMYFSLELYTHNHPFVKNLFNRRLKAAEEKYHSHCWGTVVQDEKRAATLLEDNRVQTSKTLFYIPISRLGGARSIRSTWLRDQLNLSGNETLMLAYGIICKERLSVELANAAQCFPEGWRLVFHGYGNESVIQEITELDIKHRVSISLNMVPASQQEYVVASAHIGIVLYNGISINDRLTGFSSEKLALCLQCGLPVIALNFPSYEHIRQRRCGILINSLAEMNEAISQILGDYSGY